MPNTPNPQAAKAEALLLRFAAEAHRRKWSYDRGLDDDGVPVKSEAFDALHRLGEEMRTALEELRRTPAVVPSAAETTNRAALRDRIRRAVCEAEGFGWDTDMLEPDEYGEVADAVLAVLPAPVDRAAVLREAADAITAVIEADRAYSPRRSNDRAALGAAREIVFGLIDNPRRLAEAPQPETEATVGSAALLALVRDFLDPDPCSFDHHGYCQAHAAGFGGEPMSCPHGRARKLLASLERPAVGEQPDTQTREAVTVHAVPLPGSNGISSCCGRPPCEFVGERLTRDPAEVTCGDDS